MAHYVAFVRIHNQTVECIFEAPNARQAWDFAVENFYPSGSTKRMIVQHLGEKDAYGRIWNLPSDELCSICGQPDNVGDCNHARLENHQAVKLGGFLPPTSTFVVV